MPETSHVEVSVVYAEPDRAFRAELSLPCGATAADAIEQSGFRAMHPDIEIRGDRLGIFARRVALDTVLHDGDRVEIYRPLKIDPREARRRRARAGSGKKS
jgi:putative ubiquitin-RnfH superfamily antitoxin RatB of RatAB toxin-antitoxin module